MKAILLISFGVLLLGMQGCAKCKGGDTDAGVVIKSLASGTCFFRGGSNVVINSQQELDSIVEKGSDCSVVTVDFNIHTVLGANYGTACNTKFTRDVEIDTLNKKYVYTVTEEGCGCRNDKLYIHDNLVVVPKMPADYTVQFVANR